MTILLCQLSLWGMVESAFMKTFFLPTGQIVLPQVHYLSILFLL
jgi:hypothetical protein